MNGLESQMQQIELKSLKKKRHIKSRSDIDVVSEGQGSTASPVPPRHPRGEGGSSPVPRPSNNGLRMKRSDSQPVYTQEEGEEEFFEISEEALAPQSGLTICGGSREVGLENLGNTCFMNSVLQCLLHIRPLVQIFLLTNKATMMKNMCLYSPTKGEVALSFARLCRDICRSSRAQQAKNAIVPKAFKKALGVYAPHLLDYNQQDCHEFLRFLLSSISDDMCTSPTANAPPQKVKSRPALARQEKGEPQADSGAEISSTNSSPKMSVVTKLRGTVAASSQSNSPIGLASLNLPDQAGEIAANEVTSQDDTAGLDAPSVHAADAEPACSTPEKDPTESVSTKSVQQQAEEAWQGYMKMNESPVTSIFGGQLQSCVQCKHCNYMSYTFDPFMDLSIEIPRSDSRSILQKTLNFTDTAKCTLESCMKKFTAAEDLEGDNMWRCDKCKQPRKAVKRLSLYKLPKVLVISLKRFRWGSSMRDKVTADVQFPVEEPLDLRPFVVEGSASATQTTCSYDLIGVANHIGGTGFGHYVAHCDVNNDSRVLPSNAPPEASLTKKSAKWICFNDGKVSKASQSEGGVSGPSAYLLFYQLHEVVQNE